MVTLIGLGFVAIGVLFIFMGRKAVAASKAEKSWPTTTGTVKTAQVTRPLSGDQRPGLGYEPQVTYEFAVDGKTFAGNRVGVIPQQGYSQAHASQIVEQNKPGAQVTVHYDPANPAHSTLKPAAAGGRFMMVLGIVFAVAGTPILLLGLAAGGA